MTAGGATVSVGSSTAPSGGKSVFVAVSVEKDMCFRFTRVESTKIVVAKRKYRGVDAGLAVVLRSKNGRAVLIVRCDEEE